MNKNVPYIIAGASGFIALICLGSAVSLSAKNKAAKADILALQEQIVRMEAHVPAPAKEPEIIYMTSTGDTNEITALKTALAEKEAELTAMTNSPPRQPRESFEDRIAKFKEEDPEGYAEMIKNRQERQQQMKYNLAERTTLFMDMDTSLMTEDELENHEALIDQMGKVWEMMELFNDPEQRPDRETMREMYQTMQETRPLMQQERTTMFKQLGYDLGYETDDAEAFADHVQEIIGATSLQMPGGGFGGGMGGGFGGGGASGGW